LYGSCRNRWNSSGRWARQRFGRADGALNRSVIGGTPLDLTSLNLEHVARLANNVTLYTASGLAFSREATQPGS